MKFDDRYTLAHKVYPYEKSPDQDLDAPVRHPVVVVGGGPIGVATALDLGQQGIPVRLGATARARLRNAHRGDGR